LAAAADLTMADRATIATDMENRRQFMIGFAKLGLGAPLLPGALWAQMNAAGANAIDTAMLKDAARISGLELSDTECDAIVEAVNSEPQPHRRLAYSGASR
jgi:hypothetical protein